MLTITIPKSEVFDPVTNEFHRVYKPIQIQMEHSLISVQKWEAKWNQPFLKDSPKKTTEQMIDYMRCMCLTPGVPEDAFYCIQQTEANKIADYIDAPMTATTFGKPIGTSGPKKKQIVTAEIIYYWMISYNIPSEYRKWHLNQLLTLIRVFNEENAPKKKRSKREILEEQRMINEANKRRYKTKG